MAPTGETGPLPLLSATAANAAAGTLFAWSVLLPSLSTELSVPADELGVVFSGALVVFALAVLFGGSAVDRYGPRRAAVVAGLLSGAGLAVAAAAQDMPTLVVGMGVLFGSGSGLTYLAAVSWASTQGRPARTWAIGLVVAAYAAGPVVAAPLGTFGTDRWGWRETLVASAVAVGLVIVVASRGLPGPYAAGASRARPLTDEPIGDSAALVALWVLFLGTCAPGLLAFAYGAEIATERGVSVGTAGLVVALMAVGNLVGRLLAAPLTLRVGLLGALSLSLGAMAVGLVALGWAPGAGVAVLGLPLVALQYGAVSALLPAATREVTGPVRFGTAYGRVFSSFGVAAVVGPAVGAALHDGADGYAGGFQASLLGGAVAFGALLAYRRRLRLASSYLRPSGGAGS